MNKKTKKRIAILRERLHKLQKMLAGAKQQRDDTKEVKELEQQLAKTREELTTLAP